MERLEQRLGVVSKCLGEVRDGGVKEKMIHNLELAMEELNAVRTVLVESVQGELTHRQLAVVTGRTEDSRLDPSIQYFGAEWSSLFSKLFNTGLNIRIFKQRLSAGYKDLLSLSSILAEMDTVQREVKLHILFLNPGGKHSQEKVTNDKRESVKYRKAKTENLRDKCTAVRQETPSGRRKRKSVIETFTNIFNLKIK